MQLHVDEGYSWKKNLKKEKVEHEVDEVTKAKQDDAYAYAMSVIKSEACDRYSSNTFLSYHKRYNTYNIVYALSTFNTQISIGGPR